MKYSATNISVGRIIRNIEDGDTRIVLEWSRVGTSKGSLTVRYGDIADARGLKRQLMNMGFVPPLEDSEWRNQIQRIQTMVARRINAGTRVTLVTSTVGWGDNFKYFAIPGQTIGIGPEFVAPNLENVITAKVGGTLAGWKCDVGNPARFSTRMMLLVSAAFAPPLLRLCGWPSFGINLRGNSSIGKSSALRAFQSVISDPQLRPHGATKRACEQLARGHRDLPLALDETGVLRCGDRSLNIRQLTYQLFSEWPDALDRNYRVANHEGTGDWKLILGSTSEGPLYPGSRKEGEHVRLIDVPPPKNPKSGLIDRLKVPDGATGPARARKIIDRINAGATANYGHALPELISKIVADPKSAKASAQKHFQYFRTRYAATAGTALESRMLDEFAICYAAGSLAISYGLLDWNPKSLEKAIWRCWIDTRNEIPNEDRDIKTCAKAICKYVRHDADLIERADAPSERDFTKYDGVEIVSGDVRKMILPQAHLQSRFQHEHHFSRALHNLKARGVISGDPKRNVYTTQIKHQDGGRRRYYCFNSEPLTRFLKN